VVCPATIAFVEDAIIEDIVHLHGGKLMVLAASCSATVTVFNSRHLRQDGRTARPQWPLPMEADIDAVPDLRLDGEITGRPR